VLQRALLPLAFSLLLGGCAAGGGVPESVSQAVDEGLSAVGTAHLAAAMDASGQLTDAAASTALEDARRELGNARTTVVELSPAAQEDRDLRGAALSVMNDCMAAVVAATESVSGADGAPTVTETDRLLESAADRLSELKKRLGGGK
jgi:hypothetical protein